MANYLPEWFNEKELDNFITEGPLTRQAWIKGLKRWARTRFMLRKMVGSVPMKYMSRAQRTKHAVMANTAIQNAREIEAARNREETIQAKRNFIRQESFGFDFDNYLEEKFTRGSQRAFNLGVRPSAGERADMKSPLTPKVKAKLKKREQRKDMRRKGLKVESFIDHLIEEEKRKPNQNTPAGKPESKEKKEERKPAPGTNKEDPKDTKDLDNIEGGDFSRVLVVKTASGEVEIITKRSNRPDNKILKGDKPNSITSTNDIEEFVKDPAFRVTPTARAIFKDKLDDLLAVKKEKGREKEDTEVAQRRAQELGKEVEKAVEDPYSLVPPPDEEKARPHGKINKDDAELLFWLQDVIDGSPLADEIKKWIGKDRVQTIRNKATQNPGYFATAEKLRAGLIEQAVVANPALADKDLVVIPFGGVRSCSDVSDFYSERGATDNTPKSDVLVMSVEDAKTLIRNISSKSCADQMEKYVKNSFRASIKKGRAPAFSSQATETLAMLDGVQITLRDYFQGNIPMEIMKDFTNLVAQTQKLVALGNRGVLRAGEGVNWTFIRKAMSKQPIDRKLTPDEQDFYNNSAGVLKEMNDTLVSLLSRREVKAAIILEQLSGANKFGEKSLGVADGIITLDDAGNFTGRIPLSKSLNEALNNDAFMSLVDETKINAGRKSREWTSSVGGEKQTGEELATSLRGEIVPGRQYNVQSAPLTASYDPLEDNKLDNLFEYTFNPPDMTISSLAPEGPSDGDQSQPDMMGFSNFQQSQQSELNTDNILSFLVQSGFIETIYADPIDFAELGMRVSAAESPIKNQIIVNGRFFEVPVMNPNISESFIDEYSVLNDEIVTFVKNGMSIDEAHVLFDEQMNYLLEGKPRNYKREYRLFHSKAKERKKRSNRVLARRRMAKRLGKKAINGKDIDHKDGNALNNGDSNLRVRSINKNRADNKHSKKSIKETWGAGLEGSWELTLKWLKETPGQLGLVDPKLIKILMGK